MGALLSLLLAIPLSAAVVLFVKRMLEHHEYTREELERLTNRETLTGMQLPTLTTEGTLKVSRDLDFELEANKLRTKGMGW